uniref:Uncharacterized protein n=1 Tax=Lepeophtheirus salmonis TaxID=72036 RepID=A0A0K2VAC9_LEPSM
MGISNFVYTKERVRFCSFFFLVTVKKNTKYFSVYFLTLIDD